MKLTQEKSIFPPISLTFETREDAELFWEIIREINTIDEKKRYLAQQISNLFSNEAIL